MIKIINKKETFFIVDKIADKYKKEIETLLKVAIPCDLYEAQEKVQTLKNKIDDLNGLPDEVLVPNEEKMQISQIELELKEAQQVLNNIQK